MQNFIRKIFDIREGEGLKATLMFSYIFLIIASLLIVKPVRNSLFLTKFGISQLPYAFILVAVSAIFIIHIHSKYANKIRLNLLILYTTLISISVFFVFWILLFIGFDSGWFYYAFYIWVAIFGVISTSQFWLFANYVFNAREAKRLFGFIGAGGISGGIFGGFTTNFLAPVFGTENLIFLCMSFLTLCIFIMGIIWKKSARFTYTEKLLQEKRVRKQYSEDSPLKLILKSRYLTLIAALVGISVIIANLVDYQYSAIASDLIKDEDQLTAFFGFWSSNFSIASLLIQLLLTSRVLKYFGVTTSLFFLPTGILIGAFCILFNPGLLSAIIIKVSDGGFKQSINKAGLELLYLPLPGNIKNQSKTFIDVFIDSLATGIGGFLLIIFTTQFHFSVQNISFVIIFIIAIWYYLITTTRQEYINSFRQAIEKRSIDLQDQNVNLEDASVFESLVKIFNSRNERQILYVLKLIENVKNENFLPYFRELLPHSSPDIKIQILGNLLNYDADFTREATELIDDDNYDVKVEAIRYLAQTSNDSIDVLHHYLSHKDYRIKSAALLCAAHANRERSDVRKSIHFKDIFDSFVEQWADYNDSEVDKTLLKINLANVIGIAGEKELYPFLQNLLNDESPEVVLAAITNAGNSRDPMFIPVLIRHLNTNFVKREARNALAEYGDDIIDTLEDYITNSDVDTRIRLGISKVLALIGTQYSVDLLFKNLDHKDLMLRYEMIKSLNKLRTNFPLLKFENQKIGKRIIKEADNYFKTLSLLYTKDSLLDVIQDTNNNALKAHQLIVKTLEEKLENTLERIFRLLELKYPPNDIINAYQAVTSKNMDQRANAIEFLDNLLDPSLKKMIIPLIERSSSAQLEKSLTYSNKSANSVAETIQIILEEDDKWLKICTVYFMAEAGISEPKWMIKKLMTEPDRATRETANYALKRLKSIS